MFRHVGIVVNDIEKQLFFYRDLLGLEILYHEIESGKFLETILSISELKIDIYKLGIKGSTIVELLHYLDKDNESKDKHINDNGITHFAITISDLDNVYNSLKSYGVQFLSPPQVNFSKTHQVCFCRDFENNLIELVQEL
jgi:catechol 2,3-dioxygenase-like lactoylglutathione lyase family enzyme